MRGLTAFLALIISSLLLNPGAVLHSARVSLETPGFLNGLWTLYFGFVVLVVAGAVKWYFQWRRNKELARAGMPQIDVMPGPEFEEYLAQLFIKQGYKVQRTGHVSDYGCDLVLQRDTVRTVVQAKRYRGKVGEDAIREAYAAMPVYHCQRAMVITNSHYSRQAVRLAKADGVYLWSRRELTKQILAMKSVPDRTNGAIPE